MNQDWNRDTEACPRCATQVPDNAAFCPACGQPLSATSTPSSTGPLAAPAWLIGSPPAPETAGQTTPSQQPMGQQNYVQPPQYWQTPAQPQPWLGQAPGSSWTSLQPADRRRLGRRGLLAVGALALVAVLAVGGLVAYAVVPHHSGPATTIVYQLTPSSGQVLTSDLTSTVRVLTQRLKNFGVDGSVTASPPDRVSVQVYGLTDLASLETRLGQTGQLEIVLLPPAVYGTINSAGNVARPEVGDKIDPTLPVQFTGEQFDPNSVSTSTDPNDRSYWLIDFSLNAAYDAQFATFTEQNVNAYFAFVLDGTIIEVPYIATAIWEGNIQISGKVTQAEANDISDALRAGQLPCPLRLVSGSAASPSSRY